MRAFPSSAAALALLLAGAAAAQTPGAPQRLGPPQRLLPNPPPAEAQVPQIVVPLPQGPARTPPTAGGIQIAPLAPVDPEWLGTLSPEQGGFPTTLWQGTTRAAVVELAGALPVTTSPALQSLERRLLLSNAMPPQGGENVSFLGKRAEKLVAMGDVEGAQALLGLGGRPDSEGLDRAAIELRFLAGENVAACKNVAEMVRRRQGAWWDRAVITCQALAKEGAKAGLGLSLLKEAKAPADPAFDTLVDAALGRQTKLPPLTEPNALHLALLRASKQPFPGDVTQVKAPAALRAIALAEGTPMPLRLAAGERAAAFGALSVERLRALYEAAEFSAEERANALTRAEAEKGPRGRALLWTAAKAQTMAGPRAELLRGLLVHAGQGKQLPLGARVIEPLLLELRPDPQLGWLGAEAARALFATGRVAEARAWLAVAEPEGAKALQPLARIAGGWDAPAVPADPKRPALLPALLAALGDQVDWTPYLKAGLREPRPMPPATLWLAQKDAVGERRLGEALLLTLPILADGERLTADPILLARGIESLRALGLDAEARAIAVEAALAAGL
jgi:hypothetical protein